MSVWVGSTPAAANEIRQVQGLSFARFSSLGGDVVLPTTADRLEGAANVVGMPRRGVIVVERSKETTATATLLAPVASVTCGSMRVPITIVADDRECSIVATGMCRIFVGATLHMRAEVPAVTCEPVILDWQVIFQ